MKQPNIDYMMEMAKNYLAGNLDIVTFTLDFPYELKCRYRKMQHEDQDYAELIYEDLYEEGICMEQNLSETEFKKLIRRKYNYIKKIAREGFW